MTAPASELPSELSSDFLPSVWGDVPASWCAAVWAASTVAYACASTAMAVGAGATTVVVRLAVAVIAATSSVIRRGEMK